VLVVYNASAGSRRRGQLVDQLVAALAKRELSGELVGDLNVLDDLVRRYRAADELRAVVAAGGDGTVAEIVNRTAADVPLSVYPLGTANLLATYFELNADPVALAATLAAGATARFDAGSANGRIFLSMVGCGFDAEVVDRMHRMRRGRPITTWSYARPILGAIGSYRYPRLRVIAERDDGTPPTELTARWAFITNLPDYAGGLRLAPEAVGTDGVLDVCTFDHGSLWNGLKYLGFVKLGLHRALRDCQMTRAVRLRVESELPVSYQLDGDPGGLLPVDIQVLPERLTLVAPE
jgi:diacylglycerol kinase (ATP)